MLLRECSLRMDNLLSERFSHEERHARKLLGQNNGRYEECSFIPLDLSDV